MSYTHVWMFYVKKIVFIYKSASYIIFAGTHIYLICLKCIDIYLYIFIYMSNEKCIFQLSNGVYQKGKKKEKRILNRFINIYGHISLVRGIIDFYSLYLSRIS